jgi:O-antigen/teichoic acid export membrane protein
MTGTPPARSIARDVLVGTGWLTGWRMASRLLGFASLLVLTQLLMPADFGVVALASSLFAAVDAMSQIGAKDALVRLPDDTTAYYDAAFTFQFARGLLTGAVLALCGLMATAWFGDPRLRYIFAILAFVAIVGGCENIGVVRLARDMNFRTQVLLQAAPRLAGFCLTMVAAAITRSYWALIAGLVASRLATTVLTYAVAPHRPRFGLVGWRYLINFSFWTWAGSLCAMVWNRSDPFLLGPVLGDTLLGVYVIGAEIAILPLTELIEPVSGALFSGFAMAHRTGTQTKESTLVVAGCLALFGIPFSIGISACSGYLVAGLLGPQWAAAQPVIAAMAWLCVFAPFSYVCGTVLQAQGHVRRNVVASGLGAILKVSVLLLVRHTQDLRRIALASVAVTCIEAGLFIWQSLAAGNSGARQLAMTLLRATVAACVTSGALWPMPGTWEMSGLSRVPALAVGGVIGASAFPIFFLCQAALWHLCGRPSGAEEQLMIHLAKAARTVRLRLSRAGGGTR